MYLPTPFESPGAEDLRRLLSEHPLGALVTRGPGGLDANHLPFEFDPEAGAHGVLRAHVARANPVWQPGVSEPEVLVIFRGVQGYISPSGYPSKHETHRQVPTWNYEVVHAHGALAIRDDERFVRGLVARLTRTHEAGQERPWKMGDAPPDYIDAMLRAIVGIEITVTRWEAKSKLSQNKEPRDRTGAADWAERGGQPALARAMRAAP